MAPLHMFTGEFSGFSSDTAVEDWSEKWIRSQPLDSDSLAKAFELRSDEEALGEVVAYSVVGWTQPPIMVC